MTSWRAKLILSLTFLQLCAGTPARAEGGNETPTTEVKAEVPSPVATARPKSSITVLDAFAVAATLSNFHDPYNWVVYSAAATYFWSKWGFKRSLDFSRGNRDILLRELDKAGIAREQREKLVDELEVSLAELQRAVPVAHQAANELDGLLKKFVRKKDGKTERVFPEGLGDFQSYVDWTSTPEAKAFFKTDAGVKFQVRYYQLIKQMTADVEIPAANVVRVTRVVFPNATLENVSSRDHTRGDVRPGTFERKADFLHDRFPIPLHDIVPMMQEYGTRCRYTLQALAEAEQVLAKDANWLRFWTRKKNLAWPAIHGGAVAVGGIGTGYFYFSSGYESHQKEAQRDSTAKENARSDFAFWVSSEKGKTALRPYYEIIRRSLNENEEEIVAMFEKRLTADEKQGIDLKSYIHNRVNDPAFLVSIEGATMQLAKLNQGDRVEEGAFLTMLENAKSDESVRKGFFQSFNKEIIKTTANKLWSDLVVGNTGEKFTIGELRLVLARADELMQDDTKIKAPPKNKEVPSAPGAATPAIVDPLKPAGAETSSKETRPGNTDIVVSPVPPTSSADPALPLGLPTGPKTN